MRMILCASLLALLASFARYASSGVLYFFGLAIKSPLHYYSAKVFSRQRAKFTSRREIIRTICLFILSRRRDII
nr:MAG TPA: hypothetical protein [Caudoviricetes sp.]